MAARFSIVIPTLNEEKFLPNLLASLAAQTDKNFDVTVVDGSSRDQTVAVAKSFAKKLPHLQVIVSKKASLPLQRNLGAAATRGKWLMFIDADSIVLPYFIERIDDYVRQEKPTMFTTWARPDSNDPRDANIALLSNITLGISRTMHKPLASGPLTVVTRQAFTRVHGYSESHSYNEDIDFSLRILKAGYPQHIIPEALYVWSLRRFRHQGTLKVLQQYTVSALPVLIFNRPLKSLRGYVMGGEVYGKKKKSVSSATLRRYERTLKKVLKELFE